MALFFVALHVVANVVWIGSILTVALLVYMGETKAARAAYLRLSTPGFIASFVFGLARVGLEPSYYLHLHWFHAKLTAAIVVIALHHVIGAKTRPRESAGSMQAAKSGAILGVGLFVFVLAVVVLVTFRTALLP